MEDTRAALKAALNRILSAEPQRMVLSAPRHKAELGERDAPRRLTLTRDGGGWQVERLTATQAFHERLEDGSDARGGSAHGSNIEEYLAKNLQEVYTQLTAHTGAREYALRVTRKGKVLTTGKAGAATEATGTPKAAGPAGLGGQVMAGPRAKAGPLPEGVAIPPLVDIGVLTAEGVPVAAMRHKYRQISRFIELAADALKALPAPEDGAPLRVVDFGCGKSALTFVLYHYITQQLKRSADIIGLDLRQDVVETCNAAAQKYGYGGLRFERGDIAAYSAAAPADMVVTLHACDTATDHALAKAVGWGARAILSVPCCQHELKGQMRSEELAVLTRYGIVKERMAALFTDAIRANLLGACGYKAQLVEFVDMEHTPKNIMIRAVRAGVPVAHRRKLLWEAQRLCDAFGLAPTLLHLLAAQGALPG